MTTKFQTDVYKLVEQVPKGKVTTYSAIAHKLGTRAYRAVGSALRRNPFAPSVPCHRVIASDGTIGGFAGKKSGPDIDRKIKMLEKEGVVVKDNRIDEKFIFRF